MSPDELDLLAAIAALFSFAIAGAFLAAGQSLRSAWVTLLGGGVLVTLVELISIYRRLYD